MNKEIEKLQSKLHEAKLERERKKAKYDSQTVILEGQRNMLKNLEVLNHDLMSEFMGCDNAVKEFQSQLKNAIDEQAKQTQENEGAES